VIPDRVADALGWMRIWNGIHSVRGFEEGQVHAFLSEELIDWFIRRPDGSEDRNLSGSSMSTTKACNSCGSARLTRAVERTDTAKARSRRSPPSTLGDHDKHDVRRPRAAYLQSLAFLPVEEE
jgi:hypothetical protein